MIASVWFVGLALALQVPPPRAAVLESEALQAERQAIRRSEADALVAISAKLVATDRAEAEAILKQIEPAPPEQGPYRFVPLPEIVPARAKPGVRGLANVAAAGPASEVEAIRARSAAALAALAQKALGGKTKHYALADECLRAVLVRDPDHAEARRLLGYVRHDDGWATPFAVDQLRSGKVLHPTYGWVDATWVPHLERGELPARGFTNPKEARWLSAAEADAQRDAIAKGWKIKTEHFEIQTDVPLSEAIAFGRKLESFHDLFFALLADVIADDSPLARRFREKPKAPARPVAGSALHSIYYFATKDEYVQFLQARGEPDIEKTLGIYIPPPAGKRRAAAFFFRDQGGALDVTSTLFHEVSHQLLIESTDAPPNAFKKNIGNYWVFEGLGTYFETVAVAPDGTLQVGGFVGPRIAVAQQRLIARREFVPVEQLVRYNQNAFNNPERIYLHYAEAMALAVFLMDCRGSKYREAFLDYVRDALRGRLRGDAGSQLDDRLGITFAALNAEFLADLAPR